MQDPTPPAPAEKAPDPYGEPETQRRNFLGWVAYQFFYRIGWQFKMESTMMAGLISYLSPSPGVMGLFTTMNAVGRNLSPLLAAPMVDAFPRKRSALLRLWGATVAAWAGLTFFLWLPAARDRGVTLWVFGAFYSLFFLLLGGSGVAQGAVLGKIIPPDSRGRAMAMGMGLSGAINFIAILVVYRVLLSGRFPEPRNYALAFSLTTLFFVLAALSVTVIQEPPSEPRRRATDLLGNLRHFARLGRENPNLARLMAINTAMGILGGMLQFYTGYWRKSGSVTEAAMPQALLLATLLQVFWQSLSSSILGRVADRHGNRILICRLLWVEASIPLAALVLGGWEPFRGHWLWYLGVYTLVGARFPLFQLLVNYLLEVVPQAEHAMALGSVTAVQLLTAPAPLLLGAVAGAWGYPIAFLIASAVGIAGAAVAQSLEEVRVR